MAKFCSQCGTQLDDAVVFCSQCGAKQEVVASTQEAVQPAAQAPVYTAPQNVAYVAPLAPKSSNISIKTIILLIAIVLQIAAVLLFSFTEVVASDQNMEITVSQNGNTQTQEQTNSETGKIFDICTPGDSDEAEQFEAYGLDISGFKTMYIIAIAIVCVAGVGVLALVITAFMKTSKSNAFGAVGIVSQLAFAGGSVLFVFVLLKNQLDKFMNDSMEIMLKSYQQYGVDMSVSVDVVNTFTVWGWVAVGLAAGALVATAAAMMSSKSEKAAAPQMPATF